MDYFYMGKREEKALPLLAILEEKPCEGTEHQYNMAVVVKLLSGVQDGILKSDTEPSIVALRNAVQEKLPCVGLENAVKGESQTNGPIENAIGRIEGVARTLKSDVSSRRVIRHFAG